MRRVYLITGASSDIGMAFIREAAEKDASALFYAHYRTMNETLAELQRGSGGRIRLIQADLAEEGGIFRVIDAVGEPPTHILHLPAGKIRYVRLRQTDTEILKQEMQVQVYSLLEIYKAFFPQMAKEKYGKAVAVVSSCTCGKPPKFLASYTTVRYALLGLIKSAAAEYAGRGIQINAISPDMVRTKFLSSIDERVIENTANSRPDGKILTPRQVVAAIEFLFSDDNPMFGENLCLS